MLPFWCPEPLLAQGSIPIFPAALLQSQLAASCLELLAWQTSINNLIGLSEGWLAHFSFVLAGSLAQKLRKVDIRYTDSSDSPV